MHVYLYNITALLLLYFGLDILLELDSTKRGDILLLHKKKKIIICQPNILQTMLHILIHTKTNHTHM